MSPITCFVLNALRHQRSEQILVNGAPACSDLCSTPCGIRDPSRNPADGQGVGTVPVLNALRHQRSEQCRPGEIPADVRCAQRLAASEIRAAIPTVNPRSLDWCSTPCGIRDPSSTSQGMATALGQCAQRLAASEIRAARVEMGLPRPHRVLNALRHQRSEQCPG